MKSNSLDSFNTLGLNKITFGHNIVKDLDLAGKIPFFSRDLEI